MKKIIAFLLAAFFVVLSPVSAYAAATTESMMMYSMNTRAIPSGDRIILSSGYYNIDSNSWVFGTGTTLSDGATSTQGTYYATTFSNQDTNKIYPAYKIRIQNDGYLGLQYSYLYSFRLLMNDVSTVLHFGQGGNNQLRLDSNAVPMNAIYKAQLSINYYDEDNTLEDTVKTYTGNLNYSLSDFGYNPNMDNYNLPYTLDISLDKIDLSEYKVRGASFEWIEFYICFPLNNSTFSKTLPTSSSEIPDTLTTFVSSTTVVGTASNPSSISFIATMDYQASDSTNSLVSNGFKNVSSSLASLKTTVTSNFTQVRTDITNSANEIKSNIQTMQTNVVNGLNNVVTSAQQNTQNIINTVTQKVDQVKETVTEVKDSILDLPNKIQEMLLGLIVPDSDTMAAKYSEFSGLLEEKLGVIYQIPMMLFDFFDTIVNAATTPQTSLTLPAFTLPWIDGSTLTVWQPIEYKIIPEGLEVLSDLIKTVTSMTVVVLTFNSVKRAYERFLRS